MRNSGAGVSSRAPATGPTCPLAGSFRGFQVCPRKIRTGVINYVFPGVYDIRESGRGRRAAARVRRRNGVATRFVVAAFQEPLGRPRLRGGVALAFVASGSGFRSSASAVARERLLAWAPMTRVVRVTTKRALRGLPRLRGAGCCSLARLLGNLSSPVSSPAWSSRAELTSVGFPASAVRSTFPW